MKTAFICTLLVVSFQCVAQQNTWQWGVSFGGGFNYIEEIEDVVVDKNGNSYAVGSCGPAFIHNDSIYQGYGKEDKYLASFSCSGQFRWIKIFGSKGDDDVVDYHLTLKNENLLLTGTILLSVGDEFTFFDTTINETIAECFIAEIDSSGQMVSFLRTGPGNNGESSPFGILKHNSNFYIGIRNSPGMLFNNANLLEGAHIITLNEQLEYMASIMISPTLHSDQISTFNLDKSGNYYIAGNRDLNDTIGGQTGRSGAFLAKFNPSGQMEWITGEEQSGTYLFGMDVKDNNVCISGWVTNGAVISGDTISGIGGAGSTHFVACYDQDGILKWLHHADSVSTISGASDVMFLKDKIVATGFYTGHAKYGDYTLTSLGNSDPSLVWYDLNGNVTNAISLHGTGNGPDGAQNLAHDPNGNLYVGGTFANELYVAGDTLRHQWSDRDIFIAKYGVAQCRDTSTGTAVIATPKPTAEVNVFPNPMDNKAVVRFMDVHDQDVFFTLYDMQGRKVRNEVIPAGSTTITLSRGTLTSGLYLWQVRSSGKQVASGKLVVE